MGCRFEPYLWSHLSFPGFHRPSVLGLPFRLFPQFPVVPVVPVLSTFGGAWDWAPSGIDRGPVLGGMTG